MILFTLSVLVSLRLLKTTFKVNSFLSSSSYLENWFVHVIAEHVFVLVAAMVEYMTQKLGIEEDKVQELCLSLYKIYGTTMAGLKVSSCYNNLLLVYLPISSDVDSFQAVGYDFDYDDFHRYSTLPPHFLYLLIILLEVFWYLKTPSFVTQFCSWEIAIRNTQA